MVIPNYDFNADLTNAKINACAYGMQPYGEPATLVPFIALVCEQEDAMLRAFDCFMQWGCSVDGDVVRVEILIQNDGGYLVVISPDIERAMHRLVPHHRLLNMLTFSVSWVKRLDSTNEFLVSLTEYTKKVLSPVVITAYSMVGNVEPKSAAEFTPIVKLPLLVIHNLGIYREADAPEHLLSIGKVATKIDNQHKRSPKKNSPKDINVARLMTIDNAFPVSKERVHRAGLIEKVRCIDGFETVTAPQIEQATINLVLSSELTGGQLFYLGLGEDYKKTIWEHVFGRIELTSMENEIEKMSATSVAKQVELDIKTMLINNGILLQGSTIRSMQNLLSSMGYVDER